VGRVAEHHVQHIHTKIGVSSRAAAALFAMEHHLLVPRDMGGAALTAGVHHLVLYEPGLGIAYPAGSIAAVEAALAAGDPETGCAWCWSGSSGSAGPRTAGSTGPDRSILGARVQVLEGQAHLASRTDPAMVAAVIGRFVSGRGCRGCGRPRRS
jgi:hypothetical protein